MKIKYNIYKTTNLVNGKFYWGVHDSIDDDYLGSGVALRNAINKYGKENFRREVKLLYRTSKEAYEDEAFIVNEDMVKNQMCYNTAIGGKGGNCGRYDKEHIDKMRESLKRRFKNKENHPNFGKHFSEETRIKMSNAQSGERNHFYGKHHSAESMAKRSARLKEKKTIEKSGR